MQPSQRTRDLALSPLRKLVSLAVARQKQGISIHRLNIGQPDLATPDAFFEELRCFDENPVSYSRSQGNELLLQAWSEYFQSIGIPFASEDLVITNGASEATALVLAALCDPGEEVLVIEPFYANYRGLSTYVGVDLIAAQAKVEEGYHLPPMHALEAALTPRCKAILISNPSNPTGTVYTREELQELVAFAQRHQLFLISDEVYRDLAYDRPAVSLMEFREAHQNIVIIDSASKRFCACGLRIGVIGTKNAEVAFSCLKLAIARLSVATVEQAALIPILKNAHALIPPVVAEFRKRRDLAYEYLSSVPEIQVAKPEGTFLAFCELPVPSAEDFAAWLITDFEYEGETALVAPGTGFFVDPARGEHTVRLACVHPPKELERAMTIFTQGLRAYSQR